MFDALPTSIAHDIIDRHGSPRSRQNVAQASPRARDISRQSDEEFYRSWLQSDFGLEAPPGQVSAKEHYRFCLAHNQVEVSRLLGMADLGKVGSLAASMRDTRTRNKLSNRYGKEQVAHAGLRAVQRLAAPAGPFDSPPRMSPAALEELVHATSALHSLTPQPVMEREHFHESLELAARGAARLITRAIVQQTQPPAPRKKAPLKVRPPVADIRARRKINIG